MNLIDAYVIEVLDIPKLRCNKWWVKVLCNSYGVESETTLMFDTEEKALTIKPGFKFLI